MTLGVDWIELDIHRSHDGELIVIHDNNTSRISDQNLRVDDTHSQELLALRLSSADQTPAHLCLLEDVLQLAKSSTTKVSIQPKSNCVQAVFEVAERLGMSDRIGFNDGNLRKLIEARTLNDSVQIFWDRPPDLNLKEDLRIAADHGFQSIVVHHSEISASVVDAVRSSGFECGAWTVNGTVGLNRMLKAGVQRIYTDDPEKLIRLKRD